MIPKNEVIGTLWSLIETNQVQEEAFSQAADGMSQHRARHVFLGHSLKCSQLAQELRNLADFLGEAPGNGNIIPHLPCSRSRPPRSVEKEIETIEECLVSVALAISRYRMALQKSLPSPISTVIRLQYDQVLEAQEQLRLLKSGIGSDMVVPSGQ